jgi:hypothetical protein
VFPPSPQEKNYVQNVKSLETIYGHGLLHQRLTIMDSSALIIIDFDSEDTRSEFLSARDAGIKKLEQAERDLAGKITEETDLSEILSLYAEHETKTNGDEDIRLYYGMLNHIENKCNITFDKKLETVTDSADGSWETKALFTPEELLSQYERGKFDYYPDWFCKQEGKKRVWYEHKDHNIRWETEHEKSDRNRYEDLNDEWNMQVESFLKEHQGIGIVLYVEFHY